MGINKRIMTLIEILALTPAEFADKIGVQRSNISHITSGRNKPSLDFLERALIAFPDISPDWLILGKGKPFRSQTNENISDDNIKDKQESYGNSIPLLFPDTEELFTDVNKDDKEVSSENSAHDNKKSEEKNDEVTNVNNYLSKKQIRKVIILYEDNSFESYEN